MSVNMYLLFDIDEAVEINAPTNVRLVNLCSNAAIESSRRVYRKFFKLTEVGAWVSSGHRTAPNNRHTLHLLHIHHYRTTITTTRTPPSQRLALYAHHSITASLSNSAVAILAILICTALNEIALSLRSDARSTRSPSLSLCARLHGGGARVHRD